jgi:outer membrane biosynthesis protein TonB
MPPPTPLPALTALIGLFRQGFWRRLAGRLFRSKATQQADEAVEDFLLPILEAIAKIAAAVQDGTYREPEYAPEPPDEAPETSGWTPPPKPPKPPPIREPEREPEPPWLSEPRPRRSRPPPAPEPAERSSPAPKPSRPQQRRRPSWPPARLAARPVARPPLPPPRVRIRSKKARVKPMATHVLNVPL